MNHVTVVPFSVKAPAQSAERVAPGEKMKRTMWGVSAVLATSRRGLSHEARSVRVNGTQAAAEVIGTTRAGFSTLVATIFSSPLCSDADTD